MTISLKFIIFLYSTFQVNKKYVINNESTKKDYKQVKSLGNLQITYIYDYYVYKNYNYRDIQGR